VSLADVEKATVLAYEYMFATPKVKLISPRAKPAHLRSDILHNGRFRYPFRHYPRAFLGYTAATRPSIGYLLLLFAE
jgi:hypothetical protein